MKSKRYRLAVCKFPGRGFEGKDESNYLLKLTALLAREALSPNGTIEWPADEEVPYVSFCRADTPIDMVRNEAVYYCRTVNKADYILMIDDDLKPDYSWDTRKKFWESSWDYLMARRHDEESFREEAMDAYERDSSRCEDFLGLTPTEIEGECRRRWPPATIGAPYCGPPPEELVYVARFVARESNTPNISYKLECFDRENAARYTGIWEVNALPTGLILYDARVFDELPIPHFAYEFTDQRHIRKATTEDFYQTRNASLLGLPQLCNWDCWAGHNKNKTVIKPMPTFAESIPNAMADAIRKGTRGKQIIMIHGGPACFQKPTESPGRPEPQEEERGLSEDKLSLLRASKACDL